MILYLNFPIDFHKIKILRCTFEKKFYLYLLNLHLQLNIEFVEVIDHLGIISSSIFEWSQLHLRAFSQVKRCAEMSRKLRFFKDQITKASLLSAMRPVMQPDIELEDLEVIFLKKKPALIKFYLFFFTGFASIFLWSLRTWSCNLLWERHWSSTTSCWEHSLLESNNVYYMLFLVIPDTACWAWAWANWNEL